MNAGTIAGGDDEVRVRFNRTVHGPVIGYARVAGTRRIVALSQRRSSAGREATDQIFFQKLTYGQVRSAADFIRAAAATPQTFNSFYADAKDIAFVTTGRLPVRPRGVNGDLPTDGSGRFEWKAYLAASRHPQDGSPSNGLLVNWNNKPARDSPPATTAGTRAGRSGSTGYSESSRGPRSTRRRPCSARPTRRRPPTRAR